MRDDRRMTFIVVPHAGTRDLTTRSYEVSYRTLRRWMIAGGLIGAMLLLMVGSWFFVAARAARVVLLEQDVERLEREVAMKEELRVLLEQLEAQNRQMRVMLGEGMERPEVSRAAPAAVDTAATPPTDSTQAMLPRVWPLPERGFVTQEPRLPGSGHPGLDVAVAVGTRILAAGRGVVQEAGEDPVYGRFVRIVHADGYETVYGHASRVLVKARQQVQAREPIALSGSTGASTAPHLHFEIRRNGVPVDPWTLVHRPE